MALAELVAAYGFDPAPAVDGDSPAAYAGYAARLDCWQPFWWRADQECMADGLAAQARMRVNPPEDLGPRHYDEFRDEIRLCECGICSESSMIQSSHEYRFYSTGKRKHLEVCWVLLLQLHAGTHEHMTLKQRCAVARAEHERRLIKARADGVSEERLAVMERGYATFKMSDFYSTGMGLGMTPGRHESALARNSEIRENLRVARQRAHDRLHPPRLSS